MTQAAPETAASPDHPFEVGQAYFIRTVTYHYTGRVTEIRGNWITLEDAAWIADSNRFFQFLTSWKTKNPEIEPYPAGVFINCDTIVDASIWTQDLPQAQQ